jgi:hypothetical protein
VSGHTPGPWRWEVNLKGNRVQLCGGARPFDLNVMDFVRWGMGGAAPRFIREEPMVMDRCDTMAVVVHGREHHESWFRTIDHPDARLIAAAPELLDALIALVNSFEKHRPKELWDNARAAIAKATD